MSILCNSLWN